MIRETITVDRALEVLNRALKADPEAIRELILHKIECNDELADDPEIQIGLYDMGGPTTTVGILGLLNGLFGEQEGWGALCAVFDLKCSQDPTHEVEDDRELAGRCSTCDSLLILGDLIKFDRSPALK